MPPPPRFRPSTRALHLFVLSSFAVAQPLFDLLSQDAAFFVARNATRWDVLATVAMLLLGAPLLLFALEVGLAMASRRAAEWLHHGLVASLVAAVALPLVKGLDGWTALVAAISVGALFAAANVRIPAIGSVLSVLAIAPVVFAAGFLTDEGIAKVLQGDDASVVASEPIEADVPVVLVVFDALPLTSLLAEDGGIDTARYPGFARLAAGSTWFRNATTVDWRTLRAVPAIVTGLRPPARATLPTLREYPANLFTLLASDYTSNVHQTYTELAPTARRRRAAFPLRMASLASDLAVLYLHIVLPPAWADALPRVDQDWEQFDDLGGSLLGGFEGRPQRFRNFLDGIEPGSEPSLHFIHAVLPHIPYRYLPSGHTYHPVDDAPGTYVAPRLWGNEEPLVWDAYQRHLLQLGLVDRLVAELLDRLEQTGLYDRSLVIVTADHGESFWPGETSRDLGAAKHPEDILTVPLFVKQPGQTRSRVERRNAETIDIVPTVADALGIALPWQADGCSLLDPACPERPRKSASTPIEGDRELRSEVLHFDAEIGFWRRSLRRKLELFEPGMEGLFRRGPHAGLVGQPLRALRVTRENAGSFELAPGPKPGAVPAREVLANVRVFGTLELAQPPSGEAWIAVATDGVIRTVVRPARRLPREGGGLRVLAMVPEPAAFDDAGTLQLFVVDGSPDAPLLLPVEVR